MYVVITNECETLKTQNTKYQTIHTHALNENNCHTNLMVSNNKLKRFVASPRQFKNVNEKRV